MTIGSNKVFSVLAVDGTFDFGGGGDFVTFATAFSSGVFDGLGSGIVDVMTNSVLTGRTGVEASPAGFSVMFRGVSLMSGGVSASVGLGSGFGVSMTSGVAVGVGSTLKFVSGVGVG